jgi:cardiolipin synthase
MWTWSLYHLAMSILFFVLFITMVFLSRGRRPIANILAWLFFMFLIPYVGVPLFIILGQRKLYWVLRKKRTMKQRHLASPSPHQKPVEVLLDTFGASPSSHSNSLEFFTTGDRAKTAILAEINAAKESILISTYILKNDSVGQEIMNALIRKAEEGLFICLLLDTVGSLLMYPRHLAKLFKKAGGKLRFIMPLFHTPFRGHINLRDHRKMMIFDSKHALLGGMNLAEEYLTNSPTAWLDMICLIKGPAVEDILYIFQSDWQFAASSEPGNYYCEFNPEEKNSGKASVQILPSGPDTIGDRIYDAFLNAIYQAKESITILTPYFILDDNLQKAFLIALRRGVKVNIIVPEFSNHPIADLVRAISLRKLSHQGASVFLYPKMSHAKLFIFDHDIAIFGSANADLRSLLLNFEISCFVYSSAEISALKEWLDTIKATCKTTLPPQTRFRMFLEDAAQLVKPLL